MSSPAKPRKPYRDIVVIGTSPGGVAALLELAKALPADFPAPTFVVMHVPADSPSMLPQLLNPVSVLKARHPQDGEVVEAGPCPCRVLCCRRPALLNLPSP